MFTDMKLPVVLTLFVIYNMLSTSQAFKEGECDVCQKVLQKFADTLTDEDREGKDAVNKMTKMFKSFCKTLVTKEERLCYYVGGLETSATSIVPHIMKQLSYPKPVDKVCKELNQKDSQICALKYDKQIDLAKADFKKLKVKDLKKILDEWGQSGACKGCAEKADYVRVIKELMPKYAPEAAKQREEL